MANIGIEHTVIKEGITLLQIHVTPVYIDQAPLDYNVKCEEKLYEFKLVLYFSIEFPFFRLVLSPL